MELWVVRELWHILDNPTFYLNQPELITLREFETKDLPQQEQKTLETVLTSLKAWMAFRSETDLSGLGLFWLGDSLKESLFPKNRRLDLFYRWEAIAATLDDQMDTQPNRNCILSLAFRDTIALTVSLGSAFILSYQSLTDFEQHLPPKICQTMEDWGITCRALPSDNTMAAKERKSLQHVLISTSLAKYLWAGNHLAVVHLICPSILSQDIPETIGQPTRDDILCHRLWGETIGFWYSL
jgi:hypothetical protein